jgi:hypothetical protein
MYRALCDDEQNYLEILISVNEIKIIVTYVYDIIVIDKLPLGQ